MQLIYAVNYQTIPLLIVASIWYLIVTTLLSIGQFYLERHFGKGATAAKGSPRDAAATTGSGEPNDLPAIRRFGDGSGDDP